MTKRIKPLTDAEVVRLQQGMENFAQIVASADTSLIQQYIQDTVPQLRGGTQYATLKKLLPSNEFEKAQHNMRLYRDLCRYVLSIQKRISAHTVDK